MENGFGPHSSRHAAETDACATVVPPVHRAGWNLANADRVLGLCVTTGVALGDFDRQVISRLGQLDAATVQVVAGLIARAYIEGRKHPDKDG